MTCRQVSALELLLAAIYMSRVPTIPACQVDAVPQRGEGNKVALLVERSRATVSKNLVEGV